MHSDIAKRVDALFDGTRFYCAESVVRVIAEAGGRDWQVPVRMATGFCSGASRTCGQCGAVSGAIMGLGLYAGRSEPGGEYEPVYAMTQEFLARFTDTYDSINCQELTGCDFRTPEGQTRFQEENIRDFCVEVSAHAALCALSILKEQGYLEEPGGGCGKQAG